MLNIIDFITQVDPLSILMYGIALLPLAEDLLGGVLDPWYADDASILGIVKQNARLLHGMM